MPELLNKVCQHIAVAHQVQAVTLVIELPAGLRLIEQVERTLRLYIQLSSQHDDYPARFSPKDFFTHNDFILFPRFPQNADTCQSLVGQVYKSDDWVWQNVTAQVLARQ